MKITEIKEGALIIDGNESNSIETKNKNKGIA